MLMLQNEAERITEMMGVLQKHLPWVSFDHIALGGLAFVVSGCCGVLLLRTASATLSSRFLRHLAVSLTLNAINVLVALTYLLLMAALAHAVVGKVKPE